MIFSEYKTPPHLIGTSYALFLERSMKIEVCGCLLFALLGTPAAQVGEAPPKPSGIQIFLALRSSVVCLKAPALLADMVLVNRDATPYSIDLTQLSVISGYSAIIDTSVMQYRSAGMSIMGDRMGPKPKTTRVTMAGGGGYTQTISFSLQNKFFNKPGFYSLIPSVSIGKLTRPADPSKAMIFELRDCD